MRMADHVAPAAAGRRRRGRARRPACAAPIRASRAFLTRTRADATADAPDDRRTASVRASGRVIRRHRGSRLAALRFVDRPRRAARSSRCRSSATRLTPPLAPAAARRRGLQARRAVARSSSASAGSPSAWCSACRATTRWRASARRVARRRGGPEPGARARARADGAARRPAARARRRRPRSARWSPPSSSTGCA